MKTRYPLALALTLTGFVAPTPSAHAQAAADTPFAPSSRADVGAVYTMTNDPDGNTIFVYRRNTDGTLKFINAVPTGGRGSGGAIDPLQSQHSLLLSADHSRLFAVNPGTSNISVFSMNAAGGLTLTSCTPSGGGFPVALAEHGTLLYVLNAGGAGSVNGFRIRRNGHLVPIEGASHLLSATSAGGGTLDFRPDGQVLAVTERLTAQIDSFTLGPSGDITDIQSQPFKTQTPFSLIFTAQGYLLDTETFNGASGAASVSSFFAPVAAPVQTITASTPLKATGACWIVATKNGRYAYVSNPGAGSGTISTVQIETGTGQIVARPNPVSPGAASAPLDLALTQNDNYLYVLTAGSGTVTGYRVSPQGDLTFVGAIGAQPAASGQNGLAAY